MAIMIFRISKAPASRPDNLSTEGCYWLYGDGKVITSDKSRKALWELAGALMENERKSKAGDKNGNE